MFSQRFSYHLTVNFNGWALPSLYLELLGSDGKVYALADYRNSSQIFNSHYFSRSLDLFGVQQLTLYLGTTPQDRKPVLVLQPGTVYNVTARDLASTFRGTPEIPRSKITVTGLNRFARAFSEIKLCLDSIDFKDHLIGNYSIVWNSHLKNDSVVLESPSSVVKIKTHRFYILLDGYPSNINFEFEPGESPVYPVIDLEIKQRIPWELKWAFYFVLFIGIIILMAWIVSRGRSTEEKS